LSLVQIPEAVFAADVCAYAVVPNHDHLVPHVDVPRTKARSSEEVVNRWTRLFSLPSIVDRWFRQETGDAESPVTFELVAMWRKRLARFLRQRPGINGGRQGIRETYTLSLRRLDGGAPAAFDANPESLCCDC
jgi:hypothetical protein